jgi:hypothetical protein
VHLYKNDEQLKAVRQYCIRRFHKDPYQIN